jgi:hypothetical protein
MTPSRAGKLSYFFLCAVPILTILFAFVTGHISYRIYVPVWLLVVVLMLLAVRSVSAGAFRSANKEKRYLAMAGGLQVLPICFLAILFGLGPPPGSREEWVATAVEQKVRFDALLAGGVCMALGLSLLKVVLVERGEKMFAQLGHTAVLIALPVFLIVTAFWHSFALEAYKIRIQNGSSKNLELFTAAMLQIWIITICEVLLTYLAIAMYARSLQLAGLFRRTGGLAYIIFSSAAILSILCYPLYPGSEPFSGFPYYPFMIPAIPIMLSYYMGVNIIKHAGKV